MNFPKTDFINYLYINTNDRIDEYNQRIRNTQTPDTILEPNFDPRGTQTKYTRFPILDQRKENTIRIVPQSNYNNNTNFTPPIGSVGPFSGFKVDDETILQNRVFPLQSSDQCVYIPSTNSDLYNSGKTVVQRPSEQPFPGLFEKQVFYNYTHPNLENNKIGKDKFHNNTRVQLRNTVDYE
jgi:hypothetical protein